MKRPEEFPDQVKKRTESPTECFNRYFDKYVKFSNGATINMVHEKDYHFFQDHITEINEYAHLYGWDVRMHTDIIYPETNYYEMIISRI